MIDPILSLSFNIFNNKGTYALLLGSGISRSAGIATGWEILIDLINKIAELSKETIDTTPEDWYLNKFNKDPNYSDLLEMTFRTTTERNTFLRKYFEPTEDELEQGLKTPTKAHNAIAKLVRYGFIKTIITTNFDRLLEKALENENIIPNIISTDDNIKGALPIIHSNCTIIKVNGDYTDTRIRNTFHELENYAPELTNLLDRVFDEFGLIVCGWSAEWDIGLKKAMERRSNRRFSTYWVIKDTISNSAEALIRQFSADIIGNTTADNFFSNLVENVIAIQDTEKPHPISVKSAIASTKRYLSEEKFNIIYKDLVIYETKKIIEFLSSDILNTQTHYEINEFIKRIKYCEANSEILLNIFIISAYWGNSFHFQCISESISAILNALPNEGGVGPYIDLKRYPTFLLTYAASIAALANNKYSLLKILLDDTYVKHRDSRIPLIELLLPHTIIEKENAGYLPGMNPNMYTPLSEYITSILSPFFMELMISNYKFDELFDRFEYLFALIYLDKNDMGWAPVGMFGWRGKRYNSNNQIAILLNTEIDNLGDSHPLLSNHLFNGSTEMLKGLQNKLEVIVSRRGMY